MHGVLKIFNIGKSCICILLTVMLAGLISCRNNEGRGGVNAKPGKNEMADINRYFIQKDKERIQNYIERKGLDMKETATGLWYQIIRMGSGEYFAENDKVIMEYECSLLDGTLCYSSSSQSPKEVIVGRGGMEAGLSEGLKMLNFDSEAIFILPPYLAYGLIGDGKKIPSRAIVVYKVHILRSK